MISLTFEAGGEPAPAREILATLRAAGQRATFFLDGRWAEAHPDLVHEMVADGHELGNHGYWHPDWTELSDEEIRADLTANERAVESITGICPRPWVRPPFGAVDARVLSVLEDAGYHAVYRDAVDGAHWPGETNEDSIRERALASAGAGDVLVFHTDRPETATALPGILAQLAAASPELGTLTELGRLPSPRLELHADFAGLHVRPGHVRPRAPGRWRSLNLLEMGAARTQAANRTEEVATVGGSRLDLITGDPTRAYERPSSGDDRHLLVLAGEVRCDFKGAGNEDLGYVLARPGDLVLWPGGTGAQLSCTKRWTGLLMGRENHQ